MGGEVVVELRSANATRGGYEVLAGLSLAVPEGKAAVVMGAAGSGKSSLLKLAAGIIPGREGQVFFRGQDLARMTRAEELSFRKRSGFVFQDAALWANQSLFDNLALPIRIHAPKTPRGDLEKAIGRAVGLVGYDESLTARPSELSTGERRLIGLARALVLEPELVFMDEPAAFLDEVAGERVLGIVERLRAKGTTLLVVSGNAELAFRSADLVGVLAKGRLIAWGGYEEAVRWTDIAVKSVTGRLKVRVPVRKAPGGLLGDWERAILGEAGPAGGESKPGEVP